MNELERQNFEEEEEEEEKRKKEVDEIGRKVTFLKRNNKE
jgi:hypothetical protein